MSRDRHERRSEPKSKLEEKGQLGHRVRRSAALLETVNTSVRSQDFACHFLEKTRGCWVPEITLKKRKGKVHFGRRRLVCCSLSILHIASSSSCLDI